MIIPLVQIGWSSGLAFIPCELSERISIAYDHVYYAIEELDWYAFPIELQKMLPIIMINVQEPVALQCYGSILCGRDVFKKVLYAIDCVPR